MAGGKVSRKSKGGPSESDPAALSSLMHAVVFAYEKMIYDNYAEDAISVIPYLVETLEKLLPKEFLRSLDKCEDQGERLEAITGYLNSSGFFNGVRIVKDKKGAVSVQIEDCGFARQGLHEALKPMTGSICPFALLVAALLSRSSDAQVRIEVSQSKVDRYSSRTNISVSSAKPIKKIPESILSELDAMDMDILRMMREDARLSNVDIAKALETSEATVRRRVQSLVDRGVIKGFVARIDHGRMRPKIKVYVAMVVAPDRLDSVSEILLRRGDMCAIYRSLGSFNLVSELLAGDMGAAQTFIDEMSKIEGIEKLESMVTTTAIRPCPWYGV